MIRFRTYLGMCSLCFIGAAGVGILTADSVAVADQHSFRGASKLERFIAPYPHSRFFPLGEGIHVNGHERNLAYGLTDDAPERVANWYEGIWTTQGLTLKRHERKGEITVVGIDPLGGWVRTVIASTHGYEMLGPTGVEDDRSTVVVASLSESYALRSPPKAPVPQQCHVQSFTGGKDTGVYTEMLFLVCEGFVREVVSFYDRALPTASRKEPIQFTGAESSVHINYSTDTTGVVLTATQSDEERPKVAVTLTWQER